MPKKTLLFILLILAIASFFRLWKLNEIPPGLYPDVAMYANDALESLRTGNFKFFYPDNFGREGLFMWLLALSFSIFGISIWSLKFVPALIGILTVFGLYLLTKEIFKENSKFEAPNSKQIQNTNVQNSKRSELQPTHHHPKLRLGSIWNLKNWDLFRNLGLGLRISRSESIALLSSFFLATSFWHTLFSRIGFRAILFPFILVFAFYFLFKGFNEKRILYFIISGIFFGLGFYTYISYRFIVLLLPLILIFGWLIYQKQNLQKFFILNTFYLLLTIFLVALPIGIYFLQNPQDFIGRATPVSIFVAENPVKEFGKSLILHLSMFNFYGDPNWRHNFSSSPQLSWPLGILFLIGIILSFKEIFRKSNYQTQNYYLLLPFYFLLFTFFIMLLPGILTYEGIPHSLRVIGVIPVVYIFVGIGGRFSYEKLRLIIKNKKVLLLFCLLFLFGTGYSEFNKYFFNWAKRPEVAEAYTERYANIGYFLNSLPEDVQKYVIVNELGVPLYGISIPAQSPMFIESIKYGKPRSNYLPAENLNQIKIDQKKTVIVPLYNGKLFEELQQRFPRGKIKEEKEIKFFEIE